MRYKGQSNYRHDALARTGVLLVNLGTPDAPSPAAVRRYLAEFLWDPRVVEISRPLWWLILHGLILRVRPARSARAYRKIWTDEGSPLLAISKRQADALQASLESRFGDDVVVALAMRYGRPSVAEGLAALSQADARRIVVLPLYPQYAAATTASTFDAVAAELSGWRWVPELRMVTHYHDDPGYVAAVAASVRESWSAHGQAERLLFSFHGLPRRQFLAGDPYYCHCHKTARLIAELLGLPEGRWGISFQSRLGRAEWLQPYTDVTLKQWGREGVGSVEVVCPGFSADCLETLEEIAIAGREQFVSSGGREFRYIPALNDRRDHIEALAARVIREAHGWLKTADGADAARRTAEASAVRERALKGGAVQ